MVKQNKDIGEKSVQSEQWIRLSEKLKDELSSLHFSRQEKVLRRTHPQKMTDRLGNLWNKELEIPVIPLLTVGGCLLLVMIGIFDLPFADLPLSSELKEQRELVDTGVGIYWSDLLEKAVSRR